MVCNSRFRLRRGGLTQFCINFCDTEQVISDQEEITQKLFRLPSVISNQEEISQKWVRLPRLKQDLGAARTLSLVEHAPSKFGGEPCSVRRGLVAAVNEVLCARNTFFLAEAAFRNGPSLPTALLACVSAMKGTPVLFSVF